MKWVYAELPKGAIFKLQANSTTGSYTLRATKDIQNLDDLLVEFYNQLTLTHEISLWEFAKFLVEQLKIADFEMVHVKDVDMNKLQVTYSRIR